MSLHDKVTNRSIIKIMLNINFDISQRMSLCVSLTILLFLLLPTFIRFPAANMLLLRRHCYY